MNRRALPLAVTEVVVCPILFPTPANVLSREREICARETGETPATLHATTKAHPQCLSNPTLAFLCQRYT